MAKRALILDDDRSKAGLVSIWLSKGGVESDKVYTYDEALKRIHFKYDFLILDYFLDGEHTGSEYAAEYQKKHPGCQIYVYSAIPENIKDYTTIDVSDLENFIQDKIMVTAHRTPIETKKTETKSYDIFVIKQLLDKELNDLNDLKTVVTRHDERIAAQDKIQSELKNDLEKMSKLVSGFIADHNNDAKKIILWIAGILLSVFLTFVGIEWAIIEHLIKQLVPK
jgi:CheY-like chemotaxis protein